jgi:hypothetical protein
LDLHTKQMEAYLYGTEAKQAEWSSRPLVEGGEESLIRSADEGCLDPSVGKCNG